MRSFIYTAVVVGWSGCPYVTYDNYNGMYRCDHPDVWDHFDGIQIYKENHESLQDNCPGLKTS